MVYARKAKKSRPRKRPSGVRKRTYSRKRTMFRPQSLLRVGFPKTTMVKLRYVDGFELNPGISTLATHNFRANSCFDPDLTGIGHQPMNFDLWSQLYNHYTVVGAKITARLFDNALSHSTGLVFGISLSDDSTFTTDVSTMMEQALARYTMGNAAKTDNAGRGLVARKGFSCKKFFNITNPMDNTSRIGANISSNPTELAHFIVFLGAPPGSIVDFGAHTVVINIDYVVVFSEPKEQVQS